MVAAGVRVAVRHHPRGLLWAGAVVSVALGVAFVLAGGDRAMGAVLLLTGICYAVLIALLERRDRRR